MKKAWTEEFFSHEGENYRFPAPETRFSHPMYPVNPQWQDGDRVIRLRVTPKPFQNPSAAVGHGVDRPFGVDGGGARSQGCYWQPPYGASPSAAGSTPRSDPAWKAAASGSESAGDHAGHLRGRDRWKRPDATPRRDDVDASSPTTSRCAGTEIFLNPGERVGSDAKLDWDFLEPRSLLVGSPAHVIERLEEHRELCRPEEILVGSRTPASTRERPCATSSASRSRSCRTFRAHRRSRDRRRRDSRLDQVDRTAPGLVAVFGRSRRPRWSRHAFVQHDPRVDAHLPMRTSIGESRHGQRAVQPAQFRPVRLSPDLREVETKPAVIGVDLDSAFAISVEPDVAATKVPGRGACPDYLAVIRCSKRRSGFQALILANESMRASLKTTCLPSEWRPDDRGAPHPTSDPDTATQFVDGVRTVHLERLGPFRIPTVNGVVDTTSTEAPPRPSPVDESPMIASSTLVGSTDPPWVRG